jgi:hypothetical protein
MKPVTRPTGQAEKVIVLVAVAGLLLAVGLFMAAQDRAPETRLEHQGGLLPTLTPIPGLRATITALPRQPSLSAEKARPYQEVRDMVQRCDAYHENRRQAILQQIDWVMYPATIPPEFLALYGDQWPGRLIYGAAYFTALDWKLQGQDRGSCLYPIGIRFNALLGDLNEPPLPEFE